MNRYEAESIDIDLAAQDAERETKARRWLATARHHLQMSAQFRAAGKLDDAVSSTHAAELCIREAEKLIKP